MFRSAGFDKLLGMVAVHIKLIHLIRPLTCFTGGFYRYIVFKLFYIYRQSYQPSINGARLALNLADMRFDKAEWYYVRFLILSSFYLIEATIFCFFRPKVAVAGVKKKLTSPNPHSALYALLCLESMVKNCGKLVNSLVSWKTNM